MPAFQAAQEFAESFGAIGQAIVGHDTGHAHAQEAIMAQGGQGEGEHTSGGFVWQDLTESDS